MARYLKHTATNEVVTINDDDDQKFYELLAERDGDGRQVWVQTGVHDQAVPVNVPGTIPVEQPAPEAPQATREQIQELVDQRYGQTTEPAAAPEPAPAPAKKPAAKA